jgi:hypothetical protein
VETFCKDAVIKFYLFCFGWQCVAVDVSGEEKEYMAIFLCLFGILGICLFHMRIYLPIAVSAAVLVLVPAYLFGLYTKSRVGPLTMVLYLAYALPFIHVFPYLWYDFSAPPPLTLWGLDVCPYTTDKEVIKLMAMIGAVGAAGFAAGVSFFKKDMSIGNLKYKSARDERGIVRTSSVPVFLLWITGAIVLSWLSAPQDTIFTKAYTQSPSMSAKWNFSSAWMVSYVFLLFSLVDSIFEASLKIARLKRKIVLGSFLLIVIWFQLLRGDRESIPCVFAALLMCFVWGKQFFGGVAGKMKLHWSIIFLFVMGALIVAYFVGVMRSTLAGVASVPDLFNRLKYLENVHAIRLDTMFCGTWSGVLRTPLSVAGDSIHGMLALKYGRTYLDLLLSAIPGFMADWIGYARPINGFHGPAWEMTYGIGGTHAVVVPFLNFRMAGVFFIMALWSLIFAKMERYALKRLTVSNLALLGVVCMAAPHWLWYGEKNIMNALMIWLVLSVIYRIQLFRKFVCLP